MTSRPALFYSGETTTFEKPVTVGTLLLFFLIYAAIAIVSSGVFYLIVGDHLAASLGGWFIGIVLSSKWVLHRFYKKRHRTMTKKEYHYCVKRMVWVMASFQVFFLALLFGCIQVLHVLCHKMAGQSSVCSSHFASLPNLVLYIALPIWVLVGIGLNWLFIRFLLKAHLRALAKRLHKNRCT